MATATSRAAIVSWAALLIGMAAAGQQAVAIQSTGTLLERQATAGDPSQAFTAYLPPGSDTSRRWPLLFVFDPRGRGTLAAKIFQPAAERYGWIIVSGCEPTGGGPRC